MAETIYVTADGIYSDIDIYACSIAYAELLRLEGKNAFAVVNTKFTESITAQLASLKSDYLNQDTINWEHATSIIVLDRSDTEGLRKNLDLTKITELYDHHFGYEKYWSDLLKNNAHIERVGSCATLVWEQVLKRGFSQKISQNSCLLLYAAIISNTLNFKASVTTDRDVVAAREIRTSINIPETFDADYFSSVSGSILKAPIESLLKDVKVVTILNHTFAIGQLEVWDAQSIEHELAVSCGEHLKGFENIPYFVTIAQIATGNNKLICKSEKLKKVLTAAIGVIWNGKDIATTSKLLLRKEIIREIQALKAL